MNLKQTLLKSVNFILVFILSLFIYSCATVQSKQNKFNYELSKKQFDKNLIKKPKWDGLYIETSGNLYYEVKLTAKASVKPIRGSITGRNYLVISINKHFLNNIPSEEFKGFYFKGVELLKPIEIYRLEKGFDLINILSNNIISFNLQKTEYNNNLLTELKCTSNPNYLYCEPNNTQWFLNYLKNYSKYNNAGCILIHAGNTKVSYGGKTYILCFR